MRSSRDRASARSARGRIPGRRRPAPPAPPSRTAERRSQSGRPDTARRRSERPRLRARGIRRAEGCDRAAAKPPTSLGHPRVPSGDRSCARGLDRSTPLFAARHWFPTVRRMSAIEILGIDHVVLRVRDGGKTRTGPTSTNAGPVLTGHYTLPRPRAARGCSRPLRGPEGVHAARRAARPRGARARPERPFRAYEPRHHGPPRSRGQAHRRRHPRPLRGPRAEPVARERRGARGARHERSPSTTRRSRARGSRPSAMGIGIHRGPVVAGIMGSGELLEYGVLGSNVNLASRVERLTRAHGVDILVTEAAREALDRRFRLHAMPPREVKGVAGAVVTFALEGFDSGGPTIL